MQLSGWITTQEFSIVQCLIHKRYKSAKGMKILRKETL